MQKYTVTVRQAASVIIMFMFGSTVVMGGSTSAAQDSWMTLVFGALLAAPIVVVYARILKLYPGRDLFEILEMVLGKIGSKIVMILMIWYALHLGALVMRNFTGFIQISAMPETPQMALAFAMFLVAGYMAKSGLETMARWSLVAFPLVTVMVLITTILALDKMDFNNILPIGEDIYKIADGSFQTFTFPFAESVLFLCIAGTFKKQASPYKAYLPALLFSAAVFLIVSLRNILTLGPGMSGAEYFPSYITARVINMGEFLSRLEGVIAMNFILAGVVKISVCLLGASKGAARLFGLQDYKSIVLPIGLIIVALAMILYKNTMEMFAFIPVYKFYAIPFQVIIPVIVWIVAELKTRKNQALKA